MSDDFVTLKLLIASDAMTDRDVLRRAASQAPVPLFVTEIDETGPPGGVAELLAGEAPDIAVIDSRLPQDRCQSILEAVRALPARPLLIAIRPDGGGPAEGSAEPAFDGVIAAPLDPARATELLNGCVRARFASRVLIVDDSATVRSVVRKVLQASRFRLEAHEAADGASAVERAQQEHFDIVFLDCHMPGQDGFSTLPALQRSRPGIKVVMMTATSDESMVRRARQAGAHDLLHKPFYGKDIDAVLNRLFGLVPSEAA